MHHKKRPEPQSAILTALQSVESGLRRYLSRFLVREQDIEDVVQEAFLRAFESEKSRQVHSPRSFLFRIARNLALSELARSANRLTVHMGDLSVLNVIDERADSEREFEVNRRIDELGAAIAALPPQCRRVIIMKKVFGFSHGEIARRMEISVRTVEKHLARALQRCQELDRETSESAAADGTNRIRAASADE